jgi:hypothetical protein
MTAIYQVWWQSTMAALIGFLVFIVAVISVAVPLSGARPGNGNECSAVCSSGWASL